MLSRRSLPSLLSAPYPLLRCWLRSASSVSARSGHAHANAAAAATATATATAAAVVRRVHSSSVSPLLRSVAATPIASPTPATTHAQTTTLNEATQHQHHPPTPPLSPHAPSPDHLPHKSAADDCALPYPFLARSSYNECRAMISDACGHSFRRPLLLSALLFHGSMHRSLCFLGAGLARFYVSRVAFQLYPWYEEGYLTRIKDTVLTRGNTEAAVRALGMGKVIEAVAAEQVRWMEAHRDGAWRRGGNKRFAQEATTPPSIPSPDVESLEPSSLPPHFPPLSPRLLAAQKLERILASSRTRPGSGRGGDFVPHLALEGDLLEPLLAAVYLDGGWPAVDVLAGRTLRPLLERTQSILAPSMPDEDLGSQNYKKLLQPVVQRTFGVTPAYEVVRRVSEREWTVRVVVPRGDRASRGGQRESVEGLHPVRPLPILVDGSTDRAQLTFPAFTGTRRMAEQAAARAAYVSVTNRLAGRSPEHDSPALDELAAEQHALRLRLHDIIRRSNQPTADRSRLSVDLEEVVRCIIATHSTARPQEQPASVEVDTVRPHAVDPFDQLIAAIDDDPNAAQTPHPAHSDAAFAGWTQSDSQLLVDSLHSLECWSSFPALWSLLLQTNFSLTRATTLLLMDGFAHACSLPLVIQTLRTVRSQQKFKIDRDLMLFVLSATARANPLWGWQQMEKLLEEVEETALSVPIVDVAADASRSRAPSTAHYNAALWAFVQGLHSVGLDDPASPALVSPINVLKSSDRVRSAMRVQRVSGDVMTVALCAIIDGYSNRQAWSWKAVGELERRLGVEPILCNERTACESLAAKERADLVQSGLTPPDPLHFDASHVPRTALDRRLFEQHVCEAQPIIRVITQLLQTKASAGDCKAL